MKKSLLKFLFPLAILMMLVVVSTASQSQKMAITGTTVTATLQTNDMAAPAACCSTMVAANTTITTAYAYVMQSQKESAEMLKYGLAKKSLMDITANTTTNLSAGTNNDALQLTANSLADPTVNRSNALNSSSLTALTPAVATIFTSTVAYILACATEAAVYTRTTS